MILFIFVYELYFLLPYIITVIILYRCLYICVYVRVSGLYTILLLCMYEQTINCYNFFLKSITYYCVHTIRVFGGNWIIIRHLPACLPLFAMLIDSSLSNPPPSCTATVVCCLFIYMSPFGSFSSFSQSLSLSLCLSVDCELISSFEKVMIPVC